MHHTTTPYLRPGAVQLHDVTVDDRAFEAQLSNGLRPGEAREGSILRIDPLEDRAVALLGRGGEDK